MERRIQYSLLVAALLSLCLMPVSKADLAKCVPLRAAFPSCPCFAAVDEEGREMLEAVVDCSGRSLTSVPKAPSVVSQLIYEFRLTNNSISNLEADSFQNVRVHSLDLSGNRVVSVARNALTPLEQDLRELQIDGDLTGSFNKEALSDLGNLEILTLGKYKVQFLGDRDHLYFLGLTNLKDLTLHNWDIEAIEPIAFKGPNSLRSLTISKQNMQALPLEALRDPSLAKLVSLKISGTQIHTVTDSAFPPLAYLKELDLSGNYINQLENNCFSSLGPSLEKLDLSKNLLHTGVSSFQGLKSLPNLVELDLSANDNINSLPPISQLMTADDRPLKVLLNNNKISSLPENIDIFIGTKVTSLDLSSNNINNIHEGAFNRLTKLQMLRLSAQSGLASQELVLPSSLSQAKDTLTHLYINGHKLQALSLWSLLGDLVNLEVLDLSSTGISSIPELAFRSMTKLQDLNLSSNGLSSLNQASLVGPRNTLNKLTLSGNPLTKISSCVFEEYSSFPTIALQSVSLTCDCSVGWLYNAKKEGHIQFTPDDQSPTCHNKNNAQLMSLTYDDICPDNSYSDAPCESYYSTPGTPNTPSPTLTLTLNKITSNTITLSWALSDDTEVRNFVIRVSNTYADSQFEQTLSSATRKVDATPLRSDTQHTVCVIANFWTLSSITTCTVTRTLKDGSSGSQGQNSDSDSDNTGIIVGAVVGAVLLLVVLAAILYLVCIRRKSKKGPGAGSPPVQPRHFTKPELPSLTVESRTFSRPKPRDHHDGMQVTAISDGQMGSDHVSNGRRSRVGRAEMLASNGSYKVMSASSAGSDYSSRGKPPEAVTYENDHGPLPKTPSYHQRSPSGPRQPGYYNQAFEEDKYDQIDQKDVREVTL